jgi:hypothetical protein
VRPICARLFAQFAGWPIEQPALGDDKPWISWNFRESQHSAFRSNAFVGKATISRGGVACVAGVCRNVIAASVGSGARGQLRDEDATQLLREDPAGFLIE